MCWTSIKRCSKQSAQSVTNRFPKNCELEKQIMNQHDYNPFKCEKCDKSFVLKWRLRKHLSGHEAEAFCYYFDNEKECPFDKIGCKF